MEVVIDVNTASPLVFFLQSLAHLQKAVKKNSISSAALGENILLALDAVLDCWKMVPL